MARIRLPASLFCDYELRPATVPQRLCLLLHGFSESGERIFKKLAPILPADWAVLAPNAPFPLVRDSHGPKRLGFSWYVYLPPADDYFIDMSVAREYLRGLVKALGFEGVPTTVIGFSQGGYLGPFLIADLPQIDHFIGLGSHLVADELPALLPARLDQVHGANDQVVDPVAAAATHARFMAGGNTGHFTLLPDGEHRIDAAMIAAVIAAIQAQRGLTKT